MKKIRIGSRDSLLAVAQTRLIMEKIAKIDPEISLELVTMKTTGDRILDKSLEEIGGKGLFVKELDDALLEGKVDFTVHSMKDLPMELPQELPLVALAERGDPRDVLVYPRCVRQGERFKVGTSSLRRKLQLSALFPQAEYALIRGNIVTRLEKLDSLEYDALILAAAGLQRAGFSNRISRFFSVDEMIPSAGQGILAVQGRKGEYKSLFGQIHCKKSELASFAERGFVAQLNGGCSSPVAAYAQVHGEEICLRGLYYHEPSGVYTVGQMIRKSGQSPQQLGIALAQKMDKEFDSR